MNPCERFEGLYSEQIMTKYKEDREGDLPLHIFSIGKITLKGSLISSNLKCFHSQDGKF